ncbi:MAG: outer membrane protein assembly factor BamA [Gemmatimonadota bacterium]|nr:MAG: outer membrane protein assembly factor BamA [Gemmatimonadota bacterium]
MSAQTQTTDQGLLRIDSLKVTGNVRLATPVVLSDFGIRPGDVVTSNKIQRGIQRLYASQQYEDVRVYAVGGDGGEVTLIVEVVERPYIVNYQFRGLEHIGAGGIRDTAGLSSDAPLDPSAVHSASYHIRSELSRRGYVRAHIDTTFQPTAREGEYVLVFKVTEGRRLVVAGIEFEGNQRVGAHDLIGAMRIKPEGFWWWQTGEFREDDYALDLEANLIEFYGSRGYLDFQVLGDTMIVDPTSGKTKIVINVDEGRQYRIANFEVEGNSHFPTELIEARFDPRSRSLLSRLPLVGGGGGEGDPVFDTHQWQEATDQVRQLYRNAGFLYSQVEPVVERLPDGEDGQPRVGLRWRIVENQQAYVSLVNIGGNTNTHERVVRERLLMIPGDVYAEDRLISSFQSIQGLGFFDPLPPNEAVDIRPNEEQNIDITFRVSERQTGNVNFGASVSPSTGLAGFIGYQQPNLFGQAKSGSFRWVFGSRSNDIELSYTDPAIFGSRNSAGVSLRNSRDRFGFIGLGRRRQIGGSVFFGTPFLGARWTRLTIRYSLFRDEFDSDEEELDLEQRQLLNVGTRSSVEFRVTRDRRNHPLFPTNGSRNTVGLQFVGGVLGGDGDYRKLSFESEWFTPIANLRSDPTQTPIDLALGLSLKGGVIVGDNPFFLERFYMGGVQYGPPLRGYDELSITPFGHVPRDAPGFSQLDRVGESFFGMTANIGMNLGGTVYVNAFYDAGNVWASSFGFNPTDLLRGFGIGVSVVTPVGPLGLDYAYGIDRRDVFGRPDPGWKLHFRFGQIF